MANMLRCFRRALKDEAVGCNVEKVKTEPGPHAVNLGQRKVLLG